MRALLLLLAGIAFLAATLALDVGPFRAWQQEGRDRIVAADFLLWRDCVRRHAKAHPGTEVFDAGSMSGCLPSGRISRSPWQTRKEGNFLYVFGKAPAGAVNAARRSRGGGPLVGRAVDGVLRPVPSKGHAIPLPGFVPEGALVGIVPVEAK